MKHYNEDRIDLTLFFKTVYLLVISILFSAKLFAQIPVNGFCKLQTIQTKNAYQKLITLNYNKDNFTDLLVFGGGTNKIIVHQGEKGILLSNAKEKFSYFVFDDIIRLSKRTSKNNFFVFVARNERLAGLVSFTAYGTMQLLNLIKLDSYPEKISVDDVDGDGKNEALISGRNFNGLSILKEENYILKERKIVTNKIYNDARFIDLDYDSFVDIAAFNGLTNTIELFSNLEEDEFREYRRINIDKEVDEFQTVDFNNDGYNDIIYGTKYGIEVLLGDSVSTFEDRAFLKTPVTPDEFVISDLNGDKRKDIAYLNKTSGDLVINFSLSGGDYYDPIFYLHNESLEDLKGFVSDGSEHLAVLSNNGSLFIISRINKLENNLNIAIGASPAAITDFNSFVRERKDFCFVDSFNNDLIVLISDNNKPLSKYYKFGISDSYTDILVDDTYTDSRVYYLFSYGGKFVEVIDVNFTTSKFRRDFLYTYSPIIDFQLGHDREVYSLVKQDSSVSMIQYSYHDYKYTSAVSKNIIPDAIDACMVFNKNKSVYYWNLEGNNIYFNELVLGAEGNTTNQITSFDYSTQDFSSILMKAVQLQGNEQYSPLTIINDSRSTRFYYFVNNKLHTRAMGRLINSINRKDQIQTYHNWFERKSFLYLYSGVNEKLYEAEIGMPAQRLNFNQRIESMQSNNYFVDNLAGRDLYLVYIDSALNCIKLVRIE